LRTSIAGPLRDEDDGEGAWLDGPNVVVQRNGRQATIAHRDDIQLRGRHNIANVVMASAIGSAAGFASDAIGEAIRRFRGVPHRLEPVGFANGALWINDSIATSPERTIAGLEAYQERVVLLLGGRGKNLPLDRLQELVKRRCRAVICFGEAGPEFATAMLTALRDVHLVSNLDEAVAAAASLVRDGDVVLLSPAGTSFDAYPNFEARGAHFRELVRALDGFTEKEVR
jgi:UDP-N-acetylmuramoylalanine--D-glutamate ligase